MTTLRLDDHELASCVACGLCLAHCPTYRVTGEEAASPRGRIAAMRAVEWTGYAPDTEFVGFMDLCVQCRACEVVCPSSVPFGHLMEDTRAALTREHRYQPWWRRIGYRLLGHHRLLLLLSSVGAVLQRLRLLPRRVVPVRLPVRRRALVPTGTDVWLFTGCVMDAWLRPVHEAAIRVLTAAGAGVALPSQGGDCCGALATHAGLIDEARRLAVRVMASMPGEAPILVDSAGCGAALKDYGHLLGTDEAVQFSARVLDIHEWLAPRIGAFASRTGQRERVAVQDPCHLRVQRAEQHVRTVLAPFVDTVDLDDDGLCCGAGGAYAALHPEMADELRARKVAAVTRTGAKVVASANPGCMVHLSDAGFEVRHPIEIVDQEMTRGR